MLASCQLAAGVAPQQQIDSLDLASGQARAEGTGGGAARSSRSRNSLQKVSETGRGHSNDRRRQDAGSLTKEVQNLAVTGERVSSRDGEPRHSAALFRSPRHAWVRCSSATPVETAGMLNAQRGFEEEVHTTSDGPLSQARPRGAAPAGRPAMLSSSARRPPLKAILDSLNAPEDRRPGSSANFCSTFASTFAASKCQELLAAVRGDAGLPVVMFLPNEAPTARRSRPTRPCSAGRQPAGHPRQATCCSVALLRTIAIV